MGVFLVMGTARFIGLTLVLAAFTPARACVVVRAVGCKHFRIAFRGRPKCIELLATLMVCLLAVSGNPPSAAAQEMMETDEKLEYNVKLAYLCNLGRYVDWPADVSPVNSETLVIGILGRDPFHGTLDELVVGRKIQGRKIEVRHFASLDDYRPCHILFIPRTVPAEEWKAAIEKLHGKPVILVGETPGFAAEGGCVNFYRDGENVRLEINPDALHNHYLKASSKLLSLAKIVK